MTKSAARIQARANPTLVQSMQRAVAGISSNPAATGDAESQEPREDEFQDTRHGSDASHRNPATTSRSGAQKRTPRASLSMPTAVAEHVRRVAMALTVHEARDVSLGTTVSRAMTLLEEELRSRGVTISETPVKLRSGPRHV